MLVKILNSLYDKSKAHDAMGLEELCVLFYINEKETATFRDIAKKYFSTLSGANRRIAVMSDGYRYKTRGESKNRYRKGSAFIKEKKYPDNVVSIQGSDSGNREYVITRKGKKLINEIIEKVNK